MNVKKINQTDQSKAFREFDCSRLDLAALDQRQSDLSLFDIMDLNRPRTISPVLLEVGERIVRAHGMGSAVILMMGGHVIRAGVQRYIIDLMEQGFISCLSMNGACVIHDYEFALIGQTTESVAAYIANGKFGLWKETGGLNDIVTEGAVNGLGLGEAVGRAIEERSLPNRGISLLAAAYRLGIPATVHVGIGYDITHQFPNFNGGAYGETSHRDFLRFVNVMENLEHGVIMNFGSAVMAPEVYLKALSMVRNVARQENRSVARFTTLVCDLQDLPDDYSREAGKHSAGYYFRPWKTMLVRTVADGGTSFYQRMEHKDSVPQLWAAIRRTTVHGR